MQLAELREKEARHQLQEKGLHEAFMISIMLKFVFAALETVLGVMLLFTPKVIEFVVALVQIEILEDPNDFFGTHVRQLLNPSHEAQVFGGLYLLSHGVVKLFLAAGLLRDKIWAYPAALAVFTLFILYQMVRWLSTHSVWLLVLTVVDLLVMWLIWHEYKRRQKKPDDILT